MWVSILEDDWEHADVELSTTFRSLIHSIHGVFLLCILRVLCRMFHLLINRYLFVCKINNFCPNKAWDRR